MKNTRPDSTLTPEKVLHDVEQMRESGYLAILCADVDERKLVLTFEKAKNRDHWEEYASISIDAAKLLSSEVMIDDSNTAYFTFKTTGNWNWDTLEEYYEGLAERTA